MGNQLTYEVTSKILHYFRFGRGCHYIATEVGIYKADVMCINKNKFVEIEVKTSYQDFLKDFKKSYKRYGKTIKKHEIYANANTTSQWVPHYFYYGMPEVLANKCLPDIEKTNFGLISVDDNELLPYEKDFHCKVIRRAKPLHNKIIDDMKSMLKESIIARMSSELVTNRQKLLKLNGE